MRVSIPKTASCPRSLLARGVSLVVAMIALTVSGLAQYGSIWTYSPGDGESYLKGDVVGIKYELQYPFDSEYYYGNRVRVEATPDFGSTWYSIVEDYSPYETYAEWQIPQSVPSGSEWQIRVQEYSPFGGYVVHSEGWSGRFEIQRGCVSPIFFAQIKEQTVCENDDVVLSIETDAVNPFYQWRLNGRIIAETKENTFVLSAISRDQQGQYSVTVVDECGASGNSADAFVRVNVAPSITSNPIASIEACEYSDVTLHVAASGAGIRYQWRRNGQDLPGETRATLVLSGITPDRAGSYDAVVSGDCKPSATSEASNITVRQLPRFAMQPSDVAVCANEDVVLTASVTGNQLVYQWYKNDVAIDGATDSTLRLTPSTGSLDGLYHLVATSVAPNPLRCQQQVVSRVATVSTFKAPTIVTQPISVDACIGGSTELVVVANALGDRYEWYRNGVRIPNAESNTLVIQNVSEAAAGAYTARVYSACNLGVTSNPATITVIRPVVVTTQPRSQNVLIGQQVTLSVAGSDVRSVQWFHNQRPIGGATATELVLNNVTLAQSGLYQAVLTNGCGSVVSSTARIRVTDPASLTPEITLTQTTVDGGDIPVGYSRDRTLSEVLVNTGRAPLTVISVATQGDVTLASFDRSIPFTLAPGQSATIVYTVTARRIGVLNGTITVTGDAPVPSEELTVSATGVLRYSAPTVLNYGTIQLGNQRELCAEITNSSPVSVTIDAATVPTTASVFTVVTQLPLTLSPGQRADICISFAPTVVGVVNADLSVVSSTGGNTTIALSGTGDDEVSVEDSPATIVSVYPNPAQDNVSIVTPIDATSLITIADGQGRVLGTMEGRGTVAWNTRDVSGVSLPSGVYTVIIRTDNRITRVPLAIVR